MQPRLSLERSRKAAFMLALVSLLSLLSGCDDRLDSPFPKHAVSSPGDSSKNSPAPLAFSAFDGAQISIDKKQIAAGETVKVRLLLTSSSGKKLNLNVLPVSIQLHGGSSLGTFSDFKAVSPGVFNAKFSATRAGSPSTIETTFGGKVIETSPLAITVIPGPVSAKRSIVSFDLTEQPVLKVDAESLSLISGEHAKVKFQTYDLFGNRVVAKDLEVSFSTSSGGSTAKFSKTIDHGDGTYTAEFTAIEAHGPARVQARVNRDLVLTQLPTLTVLPGTFDAKKSEILAEKNEVRAGEVTKITIRIKDREENQLASGILALDEKFSFDVTGGTSTGEVSGVEDKGDGTYVVNFVGHTAGSKTHFSVKKGKTAIGQSIDLTVLPGRPDPAHSHLGCAASRISPVGSLVCTLTLKDVHDNVSSSPVSPTFELRGGTTSGTFAPAQSTTPGVYTTVFTPKKEGSPSLVAALIDGVAATIAQPQLQVVFPSLAQSTIQVEKEKLPLDASTTVRFQARDDEGKTLPIEGLEVSFKAESNSDGSEVEFSRAQDRGEGLYEATMTGVKAGDAKQITLTVAGREFTGAKPSIMVLTR